MTVKLYKVLRLLPVIEKLLGQQIEYPVSTAYKIYKLYKEITDIENITFDRMRMLFGEDIDFTKLTESQKSVYQALLDSDMDIDDIDISADDLVSGNAKLTVNDIETIDFFLKKT